MTIRMRLTIWYSTILAVFLCFFALFSYTALEHFLRREVDQSIRTQAMDIATSKFWDRFDLRGEKDGRLWRIPPVRTALPRVEVYLQLLDSEGNIRMKSENLGDFGLPSMRAAQLSEPRYRTMNIDNRPLRMFSQPLIVGNERIGTIQVARSLDSMNRTLYQLRWLFIVEVTIFLGLSGAIGYTLAKRALRPVEEMTRTAKQIGERQDLSQRVPFSNPSDELGRLASTMNEMLEQLQRAYRQLEVSYQTQKRFASDASHQLRTPLTIIRGNIDVLRHMGTASKDDLAIALEDMAGEAEQMSRLIELLLTLARADAGQRLEKAPFEMNDLLKDVYQHTTLFAGERQLDLIGLDSVADTAVMGNQDALRQVLLILLDNAVKYSDPQGSVKIGLEREGERLTITVEDDGIGIPQEELPYIFDRFYRGDGARRFKGLGLGLSLAKWIVEEHGGHLYALPKVDKGSRFTLVLPLMSDT